MKRWEYKNFRTILYSVDDPEELTMELNNLGVDGWEMISSTGYPRFVHNKEQYLIIFKRELRN